MSRKRSVLITGAAGFIGSHAAEHFRKAGWQVVGVDRIGPPASSYPSGENVGCYFQNDLADVDSLILILAQTRPEVCIHLAGPANVAASFKDPLTDFSAHTLPLLHVLEAIRLSEIEARLLLVSSAAVYGNPESFPVSEEARIKPISPYGFYKYLQEMLVDQYRSLYGLSACKARVFSTYGPGLKQLAVWDIAQRAMRGEYTVYGTGREGRDYLFIDDLVGALRCIVENAEFSNELINVASGQATSIAELAGRIYVELGVREEPRFLSAHERIGDPTYWCAGVSRLRKIGFKQRISLDEGVRCTIDWIRANA